MRKCLLGLLLLTLCFVSITPAEAQSSDDHNRGDFGIFFDYTRLQGAKTNLFGIGGRVGVNVRPQIALEGDFAYDFSRIVGPPCLPPPATIDCINPSVTLFHGLFGLKAQTTGPVRVFAFAKAGFLHLDAGGLGATTSTHGAFYPGGGVEFGRSGSRWAIRAEAGDEIFWSGGANHNFKLTVGPQIRF